MNDLTLQNLDVGNVNTDVNVRGDLRVNKLNCGMPLLAPSGQSDGTAYDGGTGGAIDAWVFPDGNYLYVSAIGTQPLLYPVAATTGINVAGDLVDNDGWDFKSKSSLVMGTLNKDYYTIGTSPAFYAKVKFSIADVSGIDELRMGFMKDQAFNADPTSMDDFAALQHNAADISSVTNLNDAGQATTDLGYTNWADAESHTWEVRVSASGAVTYYHDGAVDSLAPAFSFDDGDNVVFWWFHRFDATSPGNIIWEACEFGLQ